MNAVAGLLMQRPVLLQEVNVLIGYADDYAWFTELVRRVFPNEGASILGEYNIAKRLERFSTLFTEKHFPLYLTELEFSLEIGEEPPWTWMRRGIPYDLQGFGYEGLHDMWTNYRIGISALATMACPLQDYFGDIGEARVAWMESAAHFIPKETLMRLPDGGIPIIALHEALRDTHLEGAALGADWVFSSTGNFFLDHSYEEGGYDGFVDPWEQEVIEDASKAWSQAKEIMDKVQEVTLWLEKDMRNNFASLLDFTLPRLSKEDNDESATGDS